MRVVQLQEWIGPDPAGEVLPLESAPPGRGPSGGADPETLGSRLYPAEILKKATELRKLVREMPARRIDHRTNIA